MSLRKSYDLFIVHAWRYHDDWNRMVDTIDAIPDFKWRNFSLPWYDPSIEPFTPDGKIRLDKSLEGQVKPAHCAIYVASIFASQQTEKWLDTALEMIHAEGKPVIVVSDSVDAAIPEQIRNQVKAVVPWHGAAIKAALISHSL